MTYKISQSSSSDSGIGNTNTNTNNNTNINAENNYNFDLIDESSFDPDDLPVDTNEFSNNSINNNTGTSTSSNTYHNRHITGPNNNDFFHNFSPKKTSIISSVRSNISSLFSSSFTPTTSSFNNNNHNTSNTSQNNRNDPSHPFRSYSNNSDSSSLENSQENENTYHLSGRNIIYDDMSAIDWQYEYSKERLRLQQLDQTPGVYGKLIWFLDISHVWIVLIATGMSVAIVAAFIDIVSRWLADIKFGYCSDFFYLPKDFCCSGLDPQDTCVRWRTWELTFHIENNVVGSYAIAYVFYIIFSIIFASSACILVLFYAPHSRFSGITEIKTILSGFIIKGLLGFKTLIFKAIGLILVVGAGLWIGKEGPLVHVACCCANITMMLFPQLYHNEAIKREILAAAASAGISVAFGSPIGGVLFSLEQLSYYFPERTLWNSFVAAMIAAVTLQFINPFRSGNLVLFQVVYDRLWHRFELVPFAVIGIIGGLYGALFTSLNISIAKWRKRNAFLTAHPILETVFVALVTGIVTYPSVYTRIPASLSLSHLFQECSDNVPGHLCDNNRWLASYFILTAAGIQGFFLTAYTFGINIPAGIIMPSMLNGALIGRAIGILMNIWQNSYPNFFLFEACPPDGPCVTPGVYALVGAASTLCGVTHLTVSTVVIMFELTGALTYVIPIMTGVMVSKWVSDSFNRKGIYESWIRFMEYPFLDNHDDQPIPDVSVDSIMTKVDDLTIIPANQVSLRFLRELFENTNSRGFPITRSVDDMTLIGYITKSELRLALESIPLHIPQDTNCTFSGHGTLNDNTELSRTNHLLVHQNHSFRPYHDDSPTLSSTSGEDSFTFGQPDNVSIYGDYDDFTHSSSTQSPINLCEFAELSPITLSWDSSLQLAASMFQKLGLRFILFTNKGELKGLLTRKDVWQLLNSLDTDVNNMDSLSESSRAAKSRLLNSISYSLRGSTDDGTRGLLYEDELSGDEEEIIFQ